MFVPFNELPADARVWIYPMSRSADTGEVSIIESKLFEFCKQWSAHGFPLKASFCVRHSHFVILALDEGAGDASGCAIDSSVRVFKYLQQQTGIDFMDRTQSAFWVENQVVLFPNNKLKELFEAGTLMATTPAFNNLIDRKGDLDANWVRPASQTWLARYITKGSLV